MITSAQNTQVKNVIKLNQKAKARREQGLFIAEGRKMFLEAPDDWIEKVYVAESLLDDEEIMQKAKCFSWDAVENSVFRQMSSQTAVLSDRGSFEAGITASYGA